MATGLAKKAFNGVTGVIGGAFDAVGDNLTVMHSVNMVNLDRKRGVFGKAVALAENAVNTATLGIAGRVKNKISHKDMKKIDEYSATQKKAAVADMMKEEAEKKVAKAEKEVDGIDNYEAKIIKKANRKGIDLSECGKSYASDDYSI